VEIKEKMIEQLVIWLNDFYAHKFPVDSKQLSEQIYNYLVPEDRVVLTVEQYENIATLPSSLEEADKLCSMHLMLDVVKRVERKKVAEKILNDLWKERNVIGQLMIFEEHLKEKAKEFGVEIKE
jgi:hypothetical protein